MSKTKRSPARRPVSRPTRNSVSPPAGKRSRPAPLPLTVSRSELLDDGSDRAFRSLVHGLFGFLARHEAVRAGHGRRIGLMGIEYTVLISIGHLAAHEGDVSVNRVAEHLYLSGAFVTLVTNKLLQRRLILKTPDPNDRRRVRLEISEEGWARLAELAPFQRQVNDIQFDCLSASEFKLLASMVERLIESSNRALRLQAYFEEQAAGAAAPEQPASAKRDRNQPKLNLQ